MGVSKTLFTSNSDEWSTPQSLFDELDKEFHFTLDVCATESNRKCGQFYSKEDDGLKKSWGGRRYGAIPRIPKLTNGLKKHSTKQNKITRRLFY